MGMEQTVSVVYGLTIKPELTERFLKYLLMKSGKDESIQPDDLQDYMFNPAMSYLTDEKEWQSIELSRNYDENTGSHFLVIYDREWSHRVDSRYESVAPVSLPNPSEYEGKLLELVKIVGIPQNKLSWIFYSVVN